MCVLESYRLVAQPVEALEQDLRQRLGRMGLDAPQQLRGEITWHAYLARMARRERTATNTYYMSGGWWTANGKGWLGIPMEAGAREEILHVPEDASLEADKAGIPEGATPDLENFDGLIKVWIERKLGSDDDVYLFWEGDHRIVRVPTTRFTFLHPVEDKGKVSWKSRSPDDRYEVVYDGHTGKIISLRVPRRFVKSIKKWLISAAVITVILLFLLVGVGLAALPLIIGLAGAIVGVVAG